MKIGIYGSAAGEITEDIKKKAREIGRVIAKQGHVVVTGACLGLPHEAVLGAFELGGKCIGYSPAIDLKSHLAEKFPQEGFAELKFVPDNFFNNNSAATKKYRNILSVMAIDAAIIIGGRTGSLNEFTIAYDLGKNIGILENSGGISNKVIKVLLAEIDKDCGSKVVFDTDPESLVKKLIVS